MKNSPARNRPSQIVVMLGLTAFPLLQGCGEVSRNFAEGVGGAGGEVAQGGAGGEAGAGGAGGAGGQGGMGAGSAKLPVPPDLQNFAWQGVQTRFLNENGDVCEGLVSIAVADQAVCYVAANKNLRCAGRIYASTYGPQFTDIDMINVEQILLSATVNSLTGNGICLTTSGDGAFCMGDYNSWGQFADGTMSPSPSFVKWGGFSNTWRLATGTFDHLCALNDAGEVWCSGYDFGPTPALQPGGPFASVWDDTFGKVHLNDPEVFRAEAGRAECQVTPNGLKCSGLQQPDEFLGSPGEVVDGTMTEVMISPNNYTRVCWLSAAGEVSCSLYDMQNPGVPTTEKRFTSGAVLALAGNRYTDTLCAVYADGSIWCVGDNKEGKLGTGNTNPLQDETMVQPPGSIDVSCK